MTQIHILIAYDITSPQRLRKVMRLCHDYGTRLQKSLYECYVSAKQFSTLQKQLSDIISPTDDTLDIYSLCQSCHMKTRHLAQYSATYNSIDPLIF